MLRSGMPVVAPKREADPWRHAHADERKFDPTSKLIFEAARQRGVRVELLDSDHNYFRLSRGGRSVVCFESLSELTSAIAFCRCDDKEVTSRLLRAVGLSVPEQRVARSSLQNQAFLRKHGALVVKPARGEQGRGVSVGVRSNEDLIAAVARAQAVSEKVLLERVVSGIDLRIIVIGGEVVAAAVRCPACIEGTGALTVRELVEQESKRRSEATDGASSIPCDEETLRCIREAGYDYDSILPAGERLPVRGGANVHTGGTIYDVTRLISDELRQVARRAAQVLEIPVVGLDLIVPELHGTKYWIVEANERPGFANHEPQPVAARFVEFLFPGRA